MIRTGMSGRALLAAAIGVFAAGTVRGQVVTYTTTGAFTPGVFGSTVCTATQCTVGGFTLSFVGSGGGYLAPTFNVDLGAFSTSYTPGDATNVPATAFTGVSFTLTINQTGPTAGSAVIADGITGTLAYNPSGSSLFWSPGAVTAVIGPVTYMLVTDQQNPGKIGISPPTTISGQNPNLTTLRASITATPEPETLLLVAPAFAGLGVGGRLRRRSSKSK